MTRQASLLRCVKQGARQQRLAWQNLSDRLARVRPALLLRQRREVFGQVERRLHEQVRRQLESWQNGFSALEGRLRLLGPEQVLARGYSITTDAATGKVLREAQAGEGRPAVEDAAESGRGLQPGEYAVEWASDASRRR